MNLLVVGAAGGTGARLVGQALVAGHHVTALARHPERITTRHERLRVVAGDALDQATIDVVLPGHTAVLSALGATTRARTTIYSQGTTNLRRSMTAAGVRRLVCLSSGALDSGVGTPAAQRLVTRLIIRPLHRHAYADMQRMEDDLAADDRVDWTVVRAPMLTNGPHTGAYRFTHDGDRALDRPTQISRADLADFILGHLDDHALFGRRVSLSY
ncbi:NAD(P)-dependent oxidoreductase [Embleya scabrispora]|uniref:NAD(P)-dependent oxidoreductase n=1 Tax=Embleya scabrispora TaxID=159449 RepID=UPI000373636F|nr:NAD(P)H-binding protein [Embleya scabrispora]MYS84996.1 NAD(P)H-binding protein [Streptomyces sp. SID5474]